MIKNVGIVVNTERDVAVQLGLKLLQWFAKKGIGVYTTEAEGKILGVPQEYTLSTLGEKVECVLTLGGDGTFLRASRLTAPYEIPILGINLGVLGFLTEVELDEINEALEKLIRGEYYLEGRMMLEARILKQGQEQKRYAALNDVVLKGPRARLITVNVYVDEEFVTTYKADGLIVASPTGSTAYSLSSGGPIVHPMVEVLILTPICAHTLHARPLVIDSGKTVRIEIVNARQDSTVIVDGQQEYPVDDGDEVTIGKAAIRTCLVRIKDYKFYNILQEKLKAEGRVGDE